MGNSTFFDRICIKFTAGSTLYLDPELWDTANAEFVAYFFDGSSNDQWYKMNEVLDGIYSVTVPSGSYKKVIFVRYNPDNKLGDNGTGWPGDDYKWNQTDDLFASDAGTNNCYKMTDWSAGEWKTYTEGGSSEETGGTGDTNYVYLNNEAGWTNCYAYAWNGSGNNVWPGTMLTVTDVNGFYMFEIGDYENIIFNSGNNGTQTSDLKIQPGKVYSNKDKNKNDMTNDDWGDYPVPAQTAFTVTSECGANGSVVFDPSIDNQIEQGTPVTITATPDPGYRLYSITSDDGTEIEVTGNTGTFTMPSNDIKITTTFVPYEAYGKVMCRSLNPDTNELGALTQDTTGVSGLVEITGTPGATVYTATANDNYQFMGWYTDADCTEIYSGLTSEFVLTQDLTLYAYFVQTTLPKHTLTLQSVENVTASISAQNGSVTIDAGNSEEVNVGATVTLTLSDLASNHRVTSVTVNETEISGSDNTYTFTMPDKDAEVVVTVEEVTIYSVTATSNNSSWGTATTSSSTAVEGTTVTLTATPNSNYTFKTWEITGEYTSSGALTDTELTITVNGNITAIATFQEDLGTKKDNYTVFYRTSSGEFSGASKSDAIVYESSSKSGVYKASLSPSNLGETSFANTNNYYMAISSSTNYENSFGLSEDLGWFTVTTETPDFVTLNAGNNDNLAGIQNYSGKNYVSFSLSKAALTESILIQYDSNTQTYTVNAYSNIPEGVVEVFAKDGTIRKDGSVNYQKYSEMADSTFSDAKELLKVKTDANEREEAYAAPGATFTITTTIEDTYRDKYYVKAFCVNGESYSIIDKSKADTENGVYTLKYTIPEDIEVRTLEITPIYFYIDEADTVTFYVEGFDSAVKEKWGDTIACHAYYDGGDDDATYDDKTKNALGGYPGQPMVYEGGKYYMQIPKYLNGDTSVPFKGITLNNYVWDDVHKNRAGGEGNNCQTYDYNDLYCISNLGSADNIIFSFKYRTKNDNDPSVKPSDTNKTTVFTNGWENLTDYYGRDVDVFGTVLTEEQINSNNRLRIISNGYQSNNVGTYATEWTVYAYENSDWTKIATLPSSSLLYASSDDLDNALSDSYDKYVTAYKALEAYKGYPAEITYEKSITGGEENGNRSDGRWYYSKIGDTISVNTRIEYAPDANGPFVEDSFIDGTAQGKDSGTKAYFTNEDYNGLTSASGLVDKSKNFTFKAESDTTGNYMFIGWYLLKEGSYTLISKEYEWYAPMTSTETYVARFIEVPDGMLTVTHELYSKAPIVDGMVAPNGGTGTCYAKVEVVDTDGNVVHTYAETTGSILIDETYIQSTSTNKLKVTLRTDIAGLSEFNAYYVNKVGGYTDLTQDSNKGATGSTTRVVNFNISELFYTNEEGIPVFYVPALNFYSDIIPVTKDYKLTFNYDDRFGNSKSYVVMGKLSESYINENLVDDTVVLTNEFIMSKAPYEDNFGKIITWSEDTISKSTNNDVLTATIGSTQTDHTVVVNYRLSEDDPWENIVLPYGSLVIKENTEEVNEEYVCVAELENSEGLKFSHWEVYTDSSLSNLVTKCYYNEFNFRAYDNYYITAVYSETPESPTTENISTTLDFLEYSRNQWTDDEGNKTSSTDKLYADFALGFNYNGLLINSLDNVKCGMALEVCGKLSQASDGSYISDLGNYSYDTDVATLKNVILNGGKYSYNGETRNVIDTEISTLTNKNRVEFYQSFNNSRNNPLYIIKCYSYMIIDDSTVVLSDPVYISLYDVANLTYTVS